MALGMAIGFLFLSGGRASISRSPAAIAALLCAVYPRFPSTAADNAFHPQAFRHLYALAVDVRLVTAVDVDSRKTVHVPISVVTSDVAGPLAMTTPCLLPEVSVLRVSVFHCDCGIDTDV